MQALSGLFSNLFNSSKPIINPSDISSHRWKSTTNKSTVFLMEQPLKVSELESWKQQLYAPDTKGNCGISGCGVVDKLNPGLNAAGVVKCPSTELKARYFTTPGGGDGGGATFECTTESLARFYNCSTEQIESCRIAQVALSLNESVRAEQLDRLKALFDENGFDVVLEKWPETDFSPLRDGLNGERHRQGKLVHALIQPKEPLSDSQLDSKTTSIISTFNIHEKARQLGQDDYEMASFFGISPREIICKSFKGDAIHQLFPFLEKLDVKSTKFHGREATNTGPQQISIHPMSELSLVHNGEINNIKNLRLFLANNDAFKSYTKWSDDDFGMSLFDVLNEFSDTAILTQYLAFCQSLGESIPDVLRRTFIPDTVHNNLTFNAEGPAFIACTDSKGHTYIARDSQGQRPAELEVAIKDGKIVAYRYGSVSGIQSPFTLPDGVSWQRMDLNPGRVVEIAPQTESGAITEFVITEYMAQGVGTLPNIESERRSSRSAREDLDASRRLNQALMDHEVKVAMGAQNKPGPWPFLCTAGITNTSASQGINVSHPLQPFHQGEGEFKGTHPILSHDTANYILEDEGTVTVNATLSKKTAKQFIDTHKGLEDEIDRIVSDCETALLEGARTLHLNFIDGSRIPMFPRELILNKVSKLLAKYNKDGLVESRQKVNLVVSTHSLMHAQDAYTLMAAGAGFVYFPHVESETVEGYNAQLDELRSELMTLSMRAGITRLAQLTGSGLYYYQHASELASHQNVVNIGSSNYDSYSALNFVYRTQLGVAKDLGITSDSPNQRLSLETSMLQHENMVVALRRINAASGISPTIMVPTENSHLRPSIVVYGAGAAGVSAIEKLSQRHYNIIWVESDEVHRGGNASYISGHHQTMYDSYLHRLKACLEREDVTYCGGLRKSGREFLLKNADYILDCRGEDPIESDPKLLRAKEFLDVAYAGEEAQTDQFRDFHPHFKEERNFQNIMIEGMGEVAYDVVKAYLGLDPRSQTPSRLFQRWKDQYPNSGLYLSSRGNADQLRWPESYCHELHEFCEENPNIGKFRLFAKTKEALPLDLQPYWAALEKNDEGEFQLPSDGINLLFNTSVMAKDLESGNITVRIQSETVDLPHIGTNIQGYIPVKAENKIGDAVGWASGNSTSMAGIEQSLKDGLSLTPKFKNLSIEERLDRESRIEDLLLKARYINKEKQCQVVDALLENREMSDADIVRILNSSESSIDSPQIIEESTDSVQSYDHLLEGVSDGSGIKVILETEAEPNVMEIETGESSLLERMATHFGFKLDALSCKGEGSCSECACFVRSVKLPTMPGSEAALVRSTGMKPSTLLAPRTICQIPAVPNRHVVIPRGTVVHDIVSKRMFSTVNVGLSMLRRIR